MRHLRRQDGIVMPVVIIIFAIALLLALVAGTQVLATQDHAKRDINSVEALQAADAGLQTTISRLDQLDLTGVNGVAGLLTSLPCIINGAGATIAVVNLTVGTNPCPNVTEKLANGASWTSQVVYDITVNGTYAAVAPYVVSIGKSGTVTRREKATLNVLNLSSPLTAVTGLSSVTMNGTAVAPAAVAAGDVRTNGSITMSTGLLGLGTSSTISGNATPGPGQAFSWTGGGPCTLWTCVLGSHAAASSAFTVSPVSNPTANDDKDFNNGGVGLCPSGTCPGGGTWSSSNEVLNLTGASLTLQAGHTYHLCKLTMTSGSSLIVPVQLTTSTVIYMEDPSASVCAGVSGAGSASLTGNAKFTNLNVALPQAFQLYAAGSAATATSVTITPAGGILGTIGSALNPLGILIYAPQSAVTLQNTLMSGMIVGKTVSLQSGTTVTNAAGLLNLPLDSLFPLFKVTRYSECSAAVPASGAAVDSGC